MPFRLLCKNGFDLPPECERIGTRPSTRKMALLDHFRGNRHLLKFDADLQTLHDNNLRFDQAGRNYSGALSLSSSDKSPARGVEPAKTWVSNTDRGVVSLMAPSITWRLLLAIGRFLFPERTDRRCRSASDAEGQRVR